MVTKHLTACGCFISLQCLIISSDDAILMLSNFLVLVTLLKENVYIFRLFGLTQLVETSCDNPLTLNFVAEEWSTYANPFILILNYFIFSMVSKYLLSIQVSNVTSVVCM